MKSRRNKSPDSTQEDRVRNDALNKTQKGPGEKKLPGEYPPQDDIMNRMNTNRVGMDVENLSRTINPENLNMNEPLVTNPESIPEDPLSQEPSIEDRRNQDLMVHPIPIVMGEDTDLEGQERSESDVTEEDLQALGPKDLSMDMGEDERLLKNRVWPVDMTGADLDIPGVELDDENEAIGSEDEENNSYSLGGDALEDNMEGK